MPQRSGVMNLLSYLGIIFLLLLVGGLWWFVGFYLPPVLDPTLPDQALRGESFGIVGALFSGLAFAGVIVAILLQRQELRLQRQELELTRDELSGQRRALEAQVAGASQQRFDSTFFQMVGLHHEIVNSVLVEGVQVSYRGRDALDRAVWSDVRAAVKGLPEGDFEDDLGWLTNEINKLSSKYNEVYRNYDVVLGHYFRNLYRILKFVDESEVPNKQTYVGLLRAQLSVSELRLLFYNFLAEGFEKFLPLAEKYQLLQNLPTNALANPVHARVLQSHRAKTAGQHLLFGG